MNHAEIVQEARVITERAELGRPADLAAVNQELQHDLGRMTASQYNGNSDRRGLIKSLIASVH